MNRLIKGAVVASAGIVALCGIDAANATEYVTNGTFGTNGSPSGAGWTVSGVVDFSNYYRSPTNDPAANFGTADRPNGTLSQILSTGAGAYTLSFDFGLVGSEGNTQTIFANVYDNSTNALLASFSQARTAASGLAVNYQTYGVSFTATGATRIQFTTDANTVSIDGVLDNVSVTNSAVPEPASWAMMIGGFGMVGAAVRRARRTTLSFS